MIRILNNITKLDTSDFASNFLLRYIIHASCNPNLTSLITIYDRRRIEQIAWTQIIWQDNPNYMELLWQ